MRAGLLSPAATDEDVVLAVLDAVAAQTTPQPPAAPERRMRAELATLRARCAALEESTARANREMVCSRQTVANADKKRYEYHGIAIRERQIRMSAQVATSVAETFSGRAEDMIRAAEQACAAAEKRAGALSEAARAVPRLTRRAIGSRGHIKKALRTVHPDKRLVACASCGPSLDAVSAELTQALALCNTVRDIVGQLVWRDAQRALQRV